MRSRSIVFFASSVGLCVTLLALPIQTQEEEQLFDTVLGRVSDHSAQWPEDVSDAADSLDPECWTSPSFLCPEGSAVTGVRFVVCTQQVAWAADPQHQDEAAAYIWDESPMSSTENDFKTIRYDNQIMIDSASFNQSEGLGDFGQLLNEGVLYHEMLHGQLGINQLLDEGVDAACRCNTPDGADGADRDHTQIPGLQDNYQVNVADLDGNTVRVRRETIQPSDDGSFEVRLEQKNYWIGTAIIPDGGNVDNAAVSDPDNDGHIVLTGRLSDPTMRGNVIVLIDPPGDFRYFFILVSPASIDIPALFSWAQILLFLVLLLLGAYFARRLRVEAT